MTSKSGENFFEIAVTPKTVPEAKAHILRFIDGFNFMGSSLDKLSNSLKTSNHKFEILTK